MTDATPDFTSLLNAPVDSAERPKPLPTGTYTFVIKGHGFDKSKNKQTPFVRFMCSPVAPGEDVDTAALPDNWQTKEMRLDFYLTQDAMFRLREFLENLGMNTSGRPFSQVIPETTNATFLGTVVHKFNQQKPNEPPFAEIDSVARAN